jgi:hypothetical protein
MVGTVVDRQDRCFAANVGRILDQVHSAPATLLECGLCIPGPLELVELRFEPANHGHSPRTSCSMSLIY